MKHLLIAVLILAPLCGFTSCSDKKPSAAETAPANKEQDFIAAFRKALESKDSKMMDLLLLKDGTPAEVVEFYTMMMDVPAGVTIESLELVTPTAEETAKFQQSLPMPDGKNYKLPITPTKQLVMIMKETGAGSSGTSKSSLPVAEKDGKLVIPLPVPAE